MFLENILGKIHRQSTLHFLSAADAASYSYYTTSILICKRLEFAADVYTARVGQESKVEASRLEKHARRSIRAPQHPAEKEFSLGTAACQQASERLVAIGGEP